MVEAGSGGGLWLVVVRVEVVGSGGGGWLWAVVGWW